MQPLRVGLNRILAVFMLLASALNFYVFMLSAKPMQLALAAVLGLVGLLYFFGNVLVVTDTEVQVKNPLGMTLKTHPIGSLADLELRDRTLYRGDQKLAYLGFVAAATDVHKLAQAIEKVKSGDRGRL